MMVPVRSTFRWALVSSKKANIISLGVGDTTEPLPQKVADAMAEYSKGLGTRAGYQGYDPPSEGKLKERIAAEMYPWLGTDRLTLRCTLSLFFRAMIYPEVGSRQSGHGVFESVVVVALPSLSVS